MTIEYSMVFILNIRMAKKSFNTKITNSNKFLSMDHILQSLYFHLWVNADKDGLVSKRICGLIGVERWYIESLIDKWFCNSAWDSVEVLFDPKKEVKVLFKREFIVPDELVEKYWKAMVEEFTNYRTEKNDKWKEKWELQKFFEIPKRLVTRNRNNSKFSTTHGSTTKNWFSKREVANRLEDSHWKDYLAWSADLWIKSI